MKARMGAARAIGLGAVTALVAAGLGVVTPTPVAQAADPVFPDPGSTSWLPVKKNAAVLTDSAGEVKDTFLDLTAAGGAVAPAAAFVSANLQHAYFRFHVASLPADGAVGGFVLQFDTDGDVSGWERALRYDLDSGVLSVLSADANSAPTAKGAVTATLPLTASARTKYANADGGADVAFAVSRTFLETADINIGAPTVVGITNEALADAGAALNANSLLGLGKAKADILGVGKSNPSWTNVASDPLPIDSDGDGIADNVDNCPINANADQQDDDSVVDNTLPDNPANDVPDGTEGLGNACDPTPRGYNWDGDRTGYMDDDCPEQYGLDPNGCVAQSITTSILRYKAKTKRFSGLVSSDYPQCDPRRNVTIYRLVKGPDAVIGKRRSDTDGKFALRVKRQPKAGKYYASVDPRWTLGARCFGVKSPQIEVG